MLPRLALPSPAPRCFAVPAYAPDVFAAAAAGGDKRASSIAAVALRRAIEPSVAQTPQTAYAAFAVHVPPSSGGTEQPYHVSTGTARRTPAHSQASAPCPTRVTAQVRFPAPAHVIARAFCRRGIAKAAGCRAAFAHAMPHALRRSSRAKPAYAVASARSLNCRVAIATPRTINDMT